MKNCILKAVSAGGYTYYVQSASNASVFLTTQRDKAQTYTYSRSVVIINLDSLKKYTCEIKEVVT